MITWQIEKALKAVVWYSVKLHNHLPRCLVLLQLQHSLQFSAKINHSLEAVSSLFLVSI